MNDRRLVLKLLSTAAASSLVDARAAFGAAGSSGGPPWPADADPQYWRWLRAHFVLRDDEVFFNTATLGSPAREVLDRVTQATFDLAATQAQWDYKPDRPNWFTGYSPEDSIRRKAAALIGADVDEIALTQNATMGMNFVADGLDLAPGDEVLQTDQEHPGSHCTWDMKAKRSGTVWKAVKLPVPANDPAEIVELVKKAIGPKTKVIAWPHVTSGLGVVHPVARICALARERGIFTVLDGAQAIGHVPVDVKALGCDAYVGSPHKWLLAPAGNGILYVRKGAASRLWTTLASTEWANEKDPGFRLQQRGTGSLPLLLGFEAAIDFHERVGGDRWRARIKELGERLRAGLAKLDRVTVYSSTHPDMCAGITTWRIAGKKGMAMQDFFWEKAKIRPRSVGDEWGVRTSTMIYNSEAEIDRLLALAKEMSG